MARRHVEVRADPGSTERMAEENSAMQLDDQLLSDEPVYMIANIRSGFLFVEKERDYYGTLKMYQDPYYFYLRAKQYYQEMAKDFRKIEEVTVLGSPIRTLGA
jgi:hypothetical protein